VFSLKGFRFFSRPDGSFAFPRKAAPWAPHSKERVRSPSG
jgi:hypothetical protein